MLKRTVFMGAILLAILGLSLPQAALAQDSAPPTSSMIVKLVSGLTADQQADVIARNGGTEVSSIPALRLHVIEVATDQLADTLARYQADPQVVRAEENKTRQAEAAPTDPLYSNQWALPMISWDLVFGTVIPTGSATVAILDTGIDASHPDLAGNVIPGTSILDGTDGLTDPSGHGTWMAGIIAARTNTEGIAGIGYAGVRVMPVTVLDANGLGQDSDVIAGVIWAADHGANVILMAFSNPGFSDNLQEAIDYAWANGVVLVAAVGNDAGSMPTFPAGDRGVIGVSATDATDQFAAFSNDGQAVFLAAPGTDIETTNIGGTYGALSGTSASAAIVAGAAALVKAVDPTLTNGVIVGRLARTADPAGTQEQTGNGRINLARALEDTGTDFIEPAGADPVGNGGPFVGPYKAAATNTDTAVGSSLNPSVFGQSVTFTATVTAHTSGGAITSGNVEFRDGGTNCSSGTVVQSGLAVNSSGQVTFTTSALTGGSHTIRACYLGTSGGSGNNPSNGTITQTVNNKTDQTITFGVLAGKTFGDSDFGVSATASSGLTVSFSSQTAGTCTVSGTTVHLVAAGTCTIRASQAGDSTYNAAPNVDRSFTIAQASSTTTVTCPANVTYTGAAQTPCSASVTGAGGLSLTPTPTYLNNVNAGTATASYTYAGDANHTGSSDTKPFTIDLAPQTISFAALADKYFGDADFTVSATGGASGQPVTFMATGPCTVTGALVHITGVGTCTITASQAGDTNYSAASDVPQSFTITDNTPPDTSVDSGPTSPTNATTATFTFSGTDNVTPPGSLTFECQLDSGGFSACTSPTTYTSLTDGPHTFAVQAKDAAGNVDPTPATWGWSVDTAPPDTILDSMPDSLTNQTTVTFTFHATEPSSTFECSLDGGAFTACTSPAAYSGLADGPHTFDVRAIDPAGNPDPTPAGFAWTVDTLAPDTLIDSHPADPTNSNTATFTFHGDLAGGDTFRCQLDADPAAACDSGTVTYPGLGAGSHTFTVTATDAAGNTDSSAASFTWTIDVTPPDTSITSGPTEGSTTTDTSASFDFEGTDNLTLPAALTFECSLDGAAFGPCTSPTSYSGLSRDAHTFAVRATDAAGNTDASPATRSWTITKLTPVLTWANPADITYPTALSGTQLNATADVAGSFTYTPASGTVLNAGNTQNLKVDFTPTDTTNYSTTSKTVTINVLQASSTVTVTVSDAVYDGNSHGGTANVTGAGGLNQAVPVKYVGRNTTVYPPSNTAPTAAGDYIAQARYPGDANHTTSNDTKNFSITKASSTVTVACTAGAPHTYTGVAQTPCTAQATGVGMSPVNVTGSLSYANNTNVGTATASASWGGDANHMGSAGSGGFAISKANATVVVTPYNVTFDTLPHTATYTITGVNGETGNTVGTVTLNTTHTNAGTYSDSWSFTGTANYNNIATQIITDVIKPRSATVNYIGQLTWVTSGTSATTAQVTLTASMQDATGTALVGATADFIDTATNKVLASGVQVSPVAGSPGTGTANKVVTLSTGQYGSQEYVILVKLTGNYDNTAQADGDKTATVVVSKMAATSETIGGGTIANNLPGKAGTYGATASGHTTFSVGMAYTKSGTNPKGKISLMIEQADGSTIYVKSNAITSVAVTGTAGNKSTVVYTKSNVIRIDSLGNATSIDSAVTLRMDAHDGTTGDTIGFTVLSSTNSTLYYSNDWYLDPTTNTWKTRSQATSPINGLTIN